MFGFIGNIGTTELLIILLVALIIFGKRLPEVARQLGRAITEFKSSLSEGMEGSDLDRPNKMEEKREPKEDSDEMKI